jgi:hypothetical protein
MDISDLYWLRDEQARGIERPEDPVERCGPTPWRRRDVRIQASGSIVSNLNGPDHHELPHLLRYDRDAALVEITDEYRGAE